MYHRIADESFDPWGLAVAPDRFADQLRWLQDNRIVLPLGEFAALHRRGALPATAIALTFDDGYACTAQVAAPLLERQGLPATIFLPAELIERGGAFWWDEVESIVLGFDGKSLQVDGRPVALGDKQPGDRHWLPRAPPRTPRQSAFHRIWGSLRTKAPVELARAMAELRHQAAPVDVIESKKPMTPGQVRAIAGDLIEFGSHALTHPSLPHLTTSEKAKEIGDSVERCRSISGSTPRAFAYPYGDYDAESEKLVEQSGFACACTAEGRPVSRESRLSALPRIAVRNVSGGRFARTIANASF